ncbi:unnamed protein product, partial [Prorocentrum cordatum]
GGLLGSPCHPQQRGGRRIIQLDRESGQLRVYHMPDPSAAWTVAFEATLPEEVPPKEEGLCLSRGAELCVFYAQDRSPHVAAVEPKSAEAEGACRVFRITDPGKAWALSPEAPPLSPKATLTPVYAKAKAGGPENFETALLSVDQGESMLSVFHAKASGKPWVLVSKIPYAGDARLCCAYVPGKPEPVLMAGSPSDRMLKLCHLNLIEWCTFKQADDTDASAPSQPVLEEKFSRKVLGWSLAGAGRMLGLLSP